MDINPEEIKKQMEALESIPCPEFEGISFPSFSPFRMKGIEKAVNDMRDFQSRESDILICTHSKSGTHWIYEIISMLKRNTTDLDKSVKSQTMLEVIPDLSVLDELPSPRILDTHCMFQFLPRKHIENKSKIVHMVRNPKDVCVSLYYHAQKDKFLNLNLPWEEYFEVWMSGKVPYGAWYDYELAIEQAEKDYPGMIYTCYYEEMKKNPVKEIEKLAEFLEVECTDKTVEDIAKATSFENMQKNKTDISAIVFGKGFIYRKGEIGDWKNHFTVSQNERFDAQFNERMKNSNYKFTFE